MTDKEALFTYRMTQAEETLSDAKKNLQSKISSSRVGWVSAIANPICFKRK